MSINQAHLPAEAFGIQQSDLGCVQGRDTGLLALFGKLASSWLPTWFGTCPQVLCLSQAA